MGRFSVSIAVACAALHVVAGAFVVPAAAPTAAQPLDSALLSVSFEFFTFPDYTKIPATTGCLSLLQSFRGSAPAVRIGGTTQDRASYDPNDASAVTYSVPDPVDAPTALTYGPQFFQLAAKLPGNVTLGLNRQLNNQSNTVQASLQAKSMMNNLFAIEFGNEPEFYSAGSPIIPSGQTWSPSADAASQNSWFSQAGPQLGELFQAAVYLQEPTWGTAELIPKLNTGGVKYIKTFSGHSYPQSACGGASTNLTQLMNHPSIVTYTSRYKSEAAAAHSSGKNYFLGETNSATCGGGGISPTFGAALWIVDYSIQAALQGVERLYFHQGTIAACPYCWWNSTTINAPFYGAAFLSMAIGTDARKVLQLDAASNTTAAYALYNPAGKPVRLIAINSQYYGGPSAGARPSTSVSFSGLSVTTVQVWRLTAPSAESQTSLGGNVTIAGRTLNSSCNQVGNEIVENGTVVGGILTITLLASEAVFIQL